MVFYGEYLGLDAEKTGRELCRMYNLYINYE